MKQDRIRLTLKLMTIGTTIGIFGGLIMLLLFYLVATFILGKYLSYEEWRYIGILSVGGCGVGGFISAIYFIKGLR